MKILYCGPYRETSGWGDAARNQILALDAAGVEVAARCVRYGTSDPQLPERILELERRSAKADVVLQNALPPHLEYHGKFKKNISYTFTETSHYADTDWPRFLNLMDDVWVPCRQNQVAAVSSGVTRPVEVVPVSCDTRKFERSYTPHRIREELKSSFIFYTIGESTRRKNLTALVAAFDLEFEPQENVELVIKSSLPGTAPEPAKAMLKAEFDRVRTGLNLYRDLGYYKRLHIYTDRLTEESLMRLHNSCDCYVSTSFGEGWGLPVFDAMGFGKTPIYNDYGAPVEYLSEMTGWPVGGAMVPVVGMQDGYPGLYTARQSWQSISITGLRVAMREVYTNSVLREAKAERGREAVYGYDLETVGLKMKHLLESDWA